MKFSNRVLSTILILMIVLAAVVPLSSVHANPSRQTDLHGLVAVSFPSGRVSPDATKIATRYVPTEFMDGYNAMAEREGGVGGVTDAYDIAVYDIVTGERTTIAGQPADASYFVEGQEDRYNVRSNPTWSPDSTQLAWTVNENSSVYGGAFQLVIYDLATATESIVVGGLSQDGMIQVVGPDLIWTEAGISVLYNNDFHFQIVTYQPDGQLISTIDLPEPMAQFLPVITDDGTQIAMQSFQQVWLLADLQTGTVADAGGVPELFSPSSDFQTLSVFQQIRVDTIAQIYVGYPDGRSERLNAADLPVISPDGASIAYRMGGKVIIQTADSITEVDDPALATGSLIWGPQAWRLREGAPNGFASMSPETQADMSNTPLLMSISSDLWAWRNTDAAPTRITSTGDVSPAVISPDGTQAIFRTTTGRFGGGFSTYRDIWLLDLTTYETRPLMQGDATAPGNDIVRLSPTWSPDGTQVAWLEMTDPGFTHQLVIFDVSEGTFSVLASDLSYPDGVFSAWVVWGNSGIAVVYDLLNNETEARVYNPDGTLLLNMNLGDIGSPYNVIWVNDAGQAKVALFNSGIDSEGLTLIDPTTGTTTSAAALEMVSPAATDDAFTAFSDDHGKWQVLNADGQSIDRLGFAHYSALNMISIAPDGHSFVFSRYGQVIVWHNGEAMVVPATGTEYSGEQPFVAWGYATYRIRPTQ